MPSPSNNDTWRMGIQTWMNFGLFLWTCLCHLVANRYCTFGRIFWTFWCCIVNRIYSFHCRCCCNHCIHFLICDSWHKHDCIWCDSSFWCRMWRSGRISHSTCLFCAHTWTQQSCCWFSSSQGILVKDPTVSYSPSSISQCLETIFFARCRWKVYVSCTQSR